MIKERMREEREECQRRRLLKQNVDQKLRSEILESARSFFRLLGFEKTRIVHICSDLGISKRTFHKYFKSLDEILDFLWAR
jgi:AcrR family transcriptional regulator